MRDSFAYIFKYKMFFTGVIFFLSFMIFSNSAHAADGVENMLVDFSEYLTGPFAKAAAGVGLGIGGGMMYFGNPRGFDVIKWTVGGTIIAIGGGSVLETLFF